MARSTKALPSGFVAAKHVVVALVGLEFIPAGTGLVEEALAGGFVVHQGVALGAGVTGDTATGHRNAVLEHHIGPHRGRGWRQAQGQAHQSDAEGQAPAVPAAAKPAGRHRWAWLAGPLLKIAAHLNGGHGERDGDPEMMVGAYATAVMYTDWTAVILLLLTAAPLAVVVATAGFFIWRQKRQKG